MNKEIYKRKRKEIRKNYSIIKDLIFPLIVISILIFGFLFFIKMDIITSDRTLKEELMNCSIMIVPGIIMPLGLGGYVIYNFFSNCIIRPKKTLLFLYRKTPSTSYYIDEKNNKYYNYDDNTMGNYYYGYTTKRYLFDVSNEISLDSFVIKENDNSSFFKIYCSNFYSPIKPYNGEIYILVILYLLFFSLLPTLIVNFSEKIETILSDDIFRNQVLFLLFSIFSLIYDFVKKIKKYKGMIQ